MASPITKQMQRQWNINLNNENETHELTCTRNKTVAQVRNSALSWAAVVKDTYQQGHADRPSASPFALAATQNLRIDCIFSNGNCKGLFSEHRPLYLFPSRHLPGAAVVTVLVVRVLFSNSQHSTCLSNSNVYSGDTVSETFRPACNGITCMQLYTGLHQVKHVISRIFSQPRAWEICSYEIWSSLIWLEVTASLNDSTTFIFNEGFKGPRRVPASAPTSTPLKTKALRSFDPSGIAQLVT
jgi:hypothetical protein